MQTHLNKSVNLEVYIILSWWAVLLVDAFFRIISALEGLFPMDENVIIELKFLITLCNLLSQFAADITGLLLIEVILCHVQALVSSTLV